MNENLNPQDQSDPGSEARQVGSSNTDEDNKTHDDVPMDIDDSELREDQNGLQGNVEGDTATMEKVEKNIKAVKLDEVSEKKDPREDFNLTSLAKDSLTTAADSLLGQRGFGLGYHQSKPGTAVKF